MDSAQDNNRFAVGEHVVYPLQGVGIIKRIEEQDFRGVDTMYYVIYLDISDMTVMIPVEKSEELGIRGIVAESEAQKAIDSISSKYEPMPVDWKARYQMNVDLLKEGSIASIAKVMQALYHRQDQGVCRYRSASSTTAHCVCSSTRRPSPLERRRKRSR